MMTTEESSSWTNDDLRMRCAACHKRFNDLFNRRHHCRLCGDVFCDRCTHQRALIPPSSIVLQPKGGKKIATTDEKVAASIAFELDDDPDRELMYTKRFNAGKDQQQEEESSTDYDWSIFEDDLISLSVASSADLSYATHGDSISNSRNPLPYGKGLEERMKLAHAPLRVCILCHDKLQNLQEELRNCNSNAMRYNSIDPTHIGRLLNSPVAFTLGHEIRKAAYTLNNLLPLPKRMNSFVPIHEDVSMGMASSENCTDACQGVAGNFGNLDGVRIPARLLELAKGVAVMTVIKTGIGFAGFEFGTGLVVSRLGSDSWSPPCAIGSASASLGALVGLQVSDHVFLLMTDEAVDIMSANAGSIQLGVDVGIAVGPVGRSAEADMGIGPNVRDGLQGDHAQGKLVFAPIYTYSQSKGFYAGISCAGKVVVTRHQVNAAFYGRPVDARELLNGDVPIPTAAQPLYDALKRCHVYATSRS